MSAGSRPGAARIVLVLATLLVVAVVAVIAAVGVAASAQPGCANCHLKDERFAAGTAATAHATAGVSCVACHVRDTAGARTEFAVYQVFGMYVRVLDPASTDATQVKDSACLQCHAKVMGSTTEASGLRIAHQSCAQGRACIACHSEVGHGAATPWPKIASMTDCVRCHQDRKAPTTCETCHTSKVEVERSSKPEFAVTHGPNWQQTHGMGEMASCSNCHQPGSCEKCHGPGVPHGTNFQLEHAALSQQANAGCTTCHDTAFCDACHLIEMPHPRSFIEGHSATVNAEGKTSCLRCHAEEDCSTCHLKHVHPGGAVGNIPSPSGVGD